MGLGSLQDQMNYEGLKQQLYQNQLQQAQAYQGRSFFSDGLTAFEKQKQEEINKNLLLLEDVC